MKYLKLILSCILLLSCEKEKAKNVNINQNADDSSRDLSTADDNRNMDIDLLMTLQKKGVNGDISAINALYNYYTYGIHDYEKAFYWGYLHDKFDKSQNLSQLAEDNIKSLISELEMKHYYSKDTGDEIPHVKE